MPIFDFEHIAKLEYNRLMADSLITEKNKADFKKYFEAIEISPARQHIIIRHLRHLFLIMPDVAGSMKDRDAVNAAFKTLRDELSPGYLETIKKAGKAFVRWHNRYITPDGWLDIKGNKKTQKRDLSPKDMWTWDDGLKLADKTNSIQLKALLLTQLDGGFRPSEYIDLNVGDIEFNKSFAIVHIRKGKTGKRDVILFRAVPYLQRWIKNHPSKDPQSPLWLQEQKTIIMARFKYDAIMRRLQRLRKRLKGFDKPIDLYSLRHSACYLSKMDNVNPELAARKFGHSVSYYTDTYARLGASDDVERYKKTYCIGIKKEADELKPVECTRCGTINEPGVVRCEQCQSPLTMDEALKGQEDTAALRSEIAEMRSAMQLIKKHLVDDKGSLKELRAALAK